jgi:predicted dehydrogenase
MNDEQLNLLNQTNEVDRRAFLKGASLSTLMMMIGGTVLVPTRHALGADAAPAKATTPPIKCGIIGCGVWGREIIGTLGLLPNAPITALCDTYGAFLRRSARSAPDAKQYEDYRQLLADPEVEAVFVATPTHQHRQIVEDALKAGKHVYCEAPIAHTVEDARAIALAARKTPKVNFQTGLNYRSDPQRHFLVDFIRTGSWGRTVSIRAQYHKKQSWRRTSASPEQEREMNWRLNQNTSLGLIGEIGIHQLDAADWFLQARPKAVTGFGSIIHWRDGRNVPDTMQAVFEYESGATLAYDATLANSFDADYEMYYGTEAALMVRQNKAWMFKEVDAPLLGWEVYARKDQFYKEVGIALVANATKLANLIDKPQEEIAYTETPLAYSLEAFLSNSFNHQSAVRDFNEAFGEDDPEALLEYLQEMNQKKVKVAGYQEGFESTVLVIKANEAVNSRSRIELKDEWFELA